MLTQLGPDTSINREAFYHRDQSSGLLKLVLKQVGKRSPGAMNFMVGNWLSVWQANCQFFQCYDINWSHLGSWLPIPFRISGSGNCDSWCACVKKKKERKKETKSNSPACTSTVGRLYDEDEGGSVNGQAHLLPGMLVPSKTPFSPKPLSFGSLVLTYRLISMRVMMLSHSSNLSSHSFSWGRNLCFMSLSQRKDHLVPTEGW